MKNINKKLWTPSMNVQQAAECAIEWCIRAREKNILRALPPQIYFSYVLSDTPALNYFHPISSVFKYSQKDVPYVDQTRDGLLRCLSVAIKAHFFIFPEQKVSHEPYFFVMPSLSEPSQTHIGLIYKIEKEDKAIVVCDKQLSELFDTNAHQVLYDFPAVVGHDSFYWFSLKKWAKIKAQSSTSLKENIESRKAALQLAREASDLEQLKQHATPLQVPYEIKDLIKPLGIEWSAKAKTWYLPQGFDIESVQEFINYIKRAL